MVGALGQSQWTTLKKDKPPRFPRLIQTGLTPLETVWHELPCRGGVGGRSARRVSDNERAVQILAYRFLMKFSCIIVIIYWNILYPKLWEFYFFPTVFIPVLSIAHKAALLYSVLMARMFPSYWFVRQKVEYGMYFAIEIMLKVMAKFQASPQKVFGYHLI